MKLVTIRDLSVNYGASAALSGVNLDIYSDDFIGIIGPNGGGKTTLVKAIIGSVEHSGTITYAPELGRYPNRSIGYLPQVNKFDRDFPISALEVIISGLQSDRRTGLNYKKRDKELAMEIALFAGVTNVINDSIGELSGGELQRVLLCRAIISNPKLLILDEPTSFIDEVFEDAFYMTLEELSKKMAIIMVSHNSKRLMDAAKSVIVINKGVEEIKK